MIDAFGSSAPGEQLIGFLRCCQAFDAINLESDWLACTQLRLGIGRPGRLMAPAEHFIFNRGEVESIGVGESLHIEHQGFTHEQRRFVTLTIGLLDGRVYTRHAFLGRKEQQANQMLPYVRKTIKNLQQGGWPVEEGPGWTSTGGFTTSVGIGFGVWQ